MESYIIYIPSSFRSFQQDKLPLMGLVRHYTINFKIIKICWTKLESIDSLQAEKMKRLNISEHLKSHVIWSKLRNDMHVRGYTYVASCGETSTNFRQWHTTNCDRLCAGLR